MIYLKQYHIKVYGTVQGVGFRYYTERLARDHHIVGTVANVDDYVEIFAQGSEDNLEQFTKAVTNGASPASSVTHYKLYHEPVDSKLDQFKVIS